MRDFKSSLLILLSVLLLVSAGMMFTAFYYFYYKTPVQVATVKQAGKDTAATGKTTHDSLMKIYSATISELDNGFDSTWVNADSLRTSLDARLSEFYKLRNEIRTVLKDSSADTDIGMARQKMIVLQERIAALRYINMDVENENKKLNALLNQITFTGKVTKQNLLKDVIENSPPLKNISKGDVFLLFELHFAAIQIKDDKEQETNMADETEKLSGSFKIKSKNIQNSNAEIMIVVLQPDGKVLQDSDWDTGTFETAEGKKMYSQKLRFENQPGEIKQLHFSLTPDKYQQGNYTLRVYHNGILIGKTGKTLS